MNLWLTTWGLTVPWYHKISTVPFLYKAPKSALSWCRGMIPRRIRHIEFCAPTHPLSSIFAGKVHKTECIEDFCFHPRLIHPRLVRGNTGPHLYLLSHRNFEFFYFAVIAGLVLKSCSAAEAAGGKKGTSSPLIYFDSQFTHRSYGWQIELIKRHCKTFDVTVVKPSDGVCQGWSVDRAVIAVRINHKVLMKELDLG